VGLVLTRYSFVDRDMFMRYLGGGIGHLEQFPPANNDSEGVAAQEDNGEEIEEINYDDVLGGPECVGHVGEDGDDSDSDGDDGDDCVEEGEDEDEDTEEDEDAEREDDLDPGGSEDEEIGNVY